MKPVFTAVTMKNAVFCDVLQCRYCENRRSSETSVHTRSTHRHIPENGILHASLSLTKETNLISEFIKAQDIGKCPDLWVKY
jgi:hypothetical protein